MRISTPEVTEIHDRTRDKLSLLTVNRTGPLIVPTIERVRLERLTKEGQHRAASFG